MWELIVIIILIILVAAVVFLTVAGHKFTGGNEPKTDLNHTMLFNGFGNYWLVREKLAAAGFKDLEHTDVIGGSLVVDKYIRLPPVDYLRLDAERYDPTRVNFDLLRVKTKLVNRFEPSSRAALVNKYKFHESARGQEFYPRACDYDKIEDNLDRAWVLRPSLENYSRVAVHFDTADTFIVKDAKSHTRAKARFDELEITTPPDNKLAISVTEYIEPALIDGCRFTPIIYFVKTSAGCKFNRKLKFLRKETKKYNRDSLCTEYEDTIDIPAEYDKMLESALDDVEKHIEKIARELVVPANARAAYEIFSAYFIVGTRAYIVGVAPHTIYPEYKHTDESIRKWHNDFASWEADIIKEEFTQIDRRE